MASEPKRIAGIEPVGLEPRSFRQFPSLASSSFLAESSHVSLQPRCAVVSGMAILAHDRDGHERIERLRNNAVSVDGFGNGTSLPSGV